MLYVTSWGGKSRFAVDLKVEENTCLLKTYADAGWRCIEIPNRLLIFLSDLPDEACHVRRMCYMIVTSRTLLWTLLTMATTLAMVAAVITPTWLIGPSRRLRGRSKASAEDEIFTPSLGLYNGCIKVHEIEQLFTENCAPFVTSFSMSSEDFPNFWKAALVLFVCGLGLLSFTLLTSLSCCCIRSVFRKSVSRHSVSSGLGALPCWMGEPKDSDGMQQ
ncbi:hypothetical protein HNY73_009020 [Argiope bruennichi]|uniref:Uncharacterized protein n=1 Tax=Argiope bruennichi TaxID=94029 RepID=A0A8T0FDC2_ARGBR|nr:hypothetical protein HNY73_009020 [Argiope bruennichi]